ncbi:MAG: RNA pyrophosphohydrolase [Hyphomicrobiales bacterium]|nr:RNA pyrophosphohydrolase [Hyphomicrobiales bacterium]
MGLSRYRRGVGAVLFNCEGLVFVGRRIDTPTRAWQLPQGGIKKSEVPAQAVMRELLEETGTNQAEILGEASRWLSYDLPEHLIGRVWNGKYVGQRQLWFALRFLGDDRDIDISADGKPEFDAWRWVRFDDIPSLVVPFKRSLYAQIVQEFEPLSCALNGLNG